MITAIKHQHIFSNHSQRFFATSKSSQVEFQNLMEYCQQELVYKCGNVS